MSNLYPKTFTSLRSWAKTNDVGYAESKRRYAQFLMLCAIASVPQLRLSLVLKGGNALDFSLQPNRSTQDLDFSLDPTGSTLQATLTDLKRYITQGCLRIEQRYGVGLSINSMEQRPKSKDSTYITFTVKIGYALQDEASRIQRMAAGEKSPSVVRLDISINEPIISTTTFVIDDQFPAIRISELEEIIGEKLRALLQQPLRRRYRPQDLLDIAVAITDEARVERPIRLDEVATILVAKAEAREVPVSKEAFHDPEVRERCQRDYADLEVTTRKRFIEFDQAWELLMGFINQLPIPDKPSDQAS